MESIFVVLVIVAMAVFLAKRGETKILKAVLLSLVTKVEEEIGDGLGALKLATVVDWLYQRVPVYLQPFFTEKELTVLVEASLFEAELYWEQTKYFE